MKITVQQTDKTLQTKNKYCTDDIVIGIDDSIKKGAQTYTPSTSNQTIAANQFLTGAQTIIGDADLVATNIKKGTQIFNVTGTLEYIDTVTSVPSTLDTLIIRNSTDGKYYLWR